MKGSRCLVVGGGGNLGGHIIRLLLERGAASVACFDLVPYTGVGAERVASHVGDITVYEQVQASLVASHSNVVFHAASVIDIRPTPSLRMHAINVDGTYNVIRACRHAAVTSLIYTSSIEVVSGCAADGTSRLLNGVDESTPVAVKHHLPYAATKAAAERLVLAAHSPSMRTCAVRPGYIVGAGSIGLRVEMTKARQRGGYYVTAQVPATISSVHPRNAAHAHLLAAERISEAEVGGCSFFIRDFEANVVQTALDAFSSTPIKPILLPLTLAYVLAYLLHVLDTLLHLLAALRGRTRHTPDDVLDIAAVNMAWVDVIVSGAKARRVLGYESLVSREQCEREAKEWSASFWAQL